MEILVDYNNLLDTDKRRGIQFVSEKILMAIGPSHFIEGQRVTIRLYDGWYEQQSPSRVAQQVSADVQRASPFTLQVRKGTENKTLRVNLELAYSLRSDPTLHLWHTFRPKSPQSNFSCQSPASAGCTISNCPLIPMERFIVKRKCPVSACNLKPSNLLIRNEQKLIDTMMAADLFSLHLNAVPAAVIVSSDDDMLPAIRMIAKCGTKVIHVLTRPPNASLSHYVDGLDSSSYKQLLI